MSSSSRPHDSQSESNNNTNANVTTSTSNNESSHTEFPQPAILRTQDSNNSSSLVHILDEIPPPPYPTDSNIQMPIPSHSRNHTTITLSSPPEYAAEPPTITTQPQAMPHPSHSHNRSLSGEDDLLLTSIKYCKICQEPEESSTAQDEEALGSYHKGKLISPCKCKGSLQYVHIGCLNRWRHSNVRQEASYRCEVCRYEYEFYRPRLARIFSSNITLHFITFVLLFSVIYLFSYMAKLVSHDRAPQDPKDDPTAPHKHGWKDIPFLNLHIIDFIIGTSVISFLGLVFFVSMICLNGFRNTRNDFCYCGGCYGCGYGYGCDFGGGDCSGDCGECGGIFAIIILIVLVIAFVLGVFGAIIFSYLLTQKVTTICLEKVHDRILEVEKES